MLTVKIYKHKALQLLQERVRVWKEDKDIARLFDKMYERNVEEGCYDGGVFDVNVIVDNDCVNWCSVVEKGEPDFDKLLELYKKGEYDVSCEDFEDNKVSYIEAVSDDETTILIRH